MFSSLPYSPNDLFGLIFLIMSGLFALARKRSGTSHFMWVSLSMLCASVAWGTTDFQNPGYPYVNWAWWWAQPLFVGTIIFLGIGILKYLPINQVWRHRLIWPVALIPLLYLLVVTLLLVSGVQMLRVLAVLGVLPPFFTIVFISLYSEKIEPWMGHGLIGLAILTIPVLTIVVSIFGPATTILRFWTGLPLIFVSLLMLVISLLREQDLLNREIGMRTQAEARLKESNNSLEHKVAERTLDLQEVVANLETFNRNISHDLRGPLGSIDVLSYLAKQMLAKGDVDGARDQLKQISQLVRSSHATLEGLLALARKSEEGVNKENTDLAKVVESCIREVLLSQGLVVGESTMPKVVVKSLGECFTDPKLLRIVLVNLLNNALKFNKHLPDLTITVGRDDTLAKQVGVQGQVCLYVNDNGIGFELEGGVDPFSPFQRMSSESKAAGHGLGLNIVKKVIHRDGGTVWLESAKDQGTTVFFTLNPKQIHKEHI